MNNAWQQRIKFVSCFFLLCMMGISNAYATVSLLQDIGGQQTGQKTQAPTAALTYMMNVVPGLYTFDYENYPKQMKRAQGFFTQQGFKGYLDNLVSQRILTRVQEEKLGVRSQFYAASKLLSEKTVETGETILALQAPLMLQYYDTRGGVRTLQYFFATLTLSSKTPNQIESYKIIQAVLTPVASGYASPPR
jgi:hypothetical protein